jgi:hypothetical protein
VQQTIETSGLSDKHRAIERYSAAAAGKSLADSRSLAKDMFGVDVKWDWDGVLVLSFPPGYSS